MTKFAAIFAAAMFVIGFAPAGQAVCNNGEIGLGNTNGVSCDIDYVHITFG